MGYMNELHECTCTDISKLDKLFEAQTTFEHIGGENCTSRKCAYYGTFGLENNTAICSSTKEDISNCIEDFENEGKLSKHIYFMQRKAKEISKQMRYQRYSDTEIYGALYFYLNTTYRLLSLFEKDSSNILKVLANLSLNLHEGCEKNGDEMNNVSSTCSAETQPEKNYTVREEKRIFVKPLKTWFTGITDTPHKSVKHTSEDIWTENNENGKLMEFRHKVREVNSDRSCKSMLRMFSLTVPNDSDYIILQDQWKNDRSSLCLCDSDSASSGNSSGQSPEMKQNGSGDRNPSDGRECHHCDKDGGTGEGGDGNRRSNNGNGNDGGKKPDEPVDDDNSEEEKNDKDNVDVTKVTNKQDSTAGIGKQDFIENGLPSSVLVANGEEWKSRRKKKEHHIDTDQAMYAMGLLSSPDSDGSEDLPEVLKKCDTCLRHIQTYSDNYGIDTNNDETPNCLLCVFLSELIQHTSKCQKKECYECRQVLLVVQHHVIMCNTPDVCDVNICSHLHARFPNDQMLVKEIEFLKELKRLLAHLIPPPRPSFDEMSEEVIKSLQSLSISDKQKTKLNLATPLSSPPYNSLGSVFSSNTSVLANEKHTRKIRRSSTKTSILQLPSIVEGGDINNQSALVSRGIPNEDDTSGTLDDNCQSNSQGGSPSLRMAGQHQGMLSLAGRPRSQSIPTVTTYQSDELRRQALMSCSSERGQPMNSYRLVPQNDQNQCALRNFLQDEIGSTDVLGAGSETLGVSLEEMYAGFSSLPQEAVVKQSGRSCDPFLSLRITGYREEPSIEHAGAISLPVRRPSSLGSFSKSRRLGIGQVNYGYCVDLRTVAKQWTYLKSRWEKKPLDCVSQREEGIIFEEYRTSFLVRNAYYQEGQHWFTSVHLGSGVAGKCFLATDGDTQFQFCAKKIHISKYHEDELLQWSELDHPGIVKLYGAIRSGDTLIILMQYVAGGTLAKFINEHRRLNQWQSLHYLEQILQVLIYLQERKILHEDLKADNILIHADETLRLAVTDFGLARYLEDEDRVPPDVSPVGTQTQWSPEKAASEGHDFRSDLWAAICILVHMLSGEHPWVRRFGTAGLLHFVIWTNSPPLEDVPSNIHPHVTELIQWGWIVDGTKRPFAVDLIKHKAFNLLGLDVEDPLLATNLASLSSSETESNIQSLQYKLNKEKNEIQVAHSLMRAPYHSNFENTESPAEILQEVLGVSENGDCETSDGDTSSTSGSVMEILESIQQQLPDSNNRLLENRHNAQSVTSSTNIEGAQLITGDFIASDDDIYLSGDNKIENLEQVIMTVTGEMYPASVPCVQLPATTTEDLDKMQETDADPKETLSTTVSMTKLLPALPIFNSSESLEDTRQVNKPLSLVIDRSAMPTNKRRNSDQVNLQVTTEKHTLVKSHSNPARVVLSSPSPDKGPSRDSGYTTGSPKKTPSPEEAFPCPIFEATEEATNSRQSSTSALCSSDEVCPNKAADLVPKISEEVKANLFSPLHTSTPQKNDGSRHSGESPRTQQRERRSFNRAKSNMTNDDLIWEELLHFRSTTVSEYYHDRMWHAKDHQEHETLAAEFVSLKTMYIQEDSEPVNTTQPSVPTESDIPGITQDELDLCTSMIGNKPAQQESIKVTFVNLNGKPIAKLAFRDINTTWGDIIQSASAKIHADGFQEFVVKRKDRTLVGIDDLVGTRMTEIEVLVTIPDEDNLWTVKDNQVKHNTSQSYNQGYFMAMDPEDIHASQI